MFSYPLLVCDVGGTNVRFASCRERGEKLSPPLRLNTAQFSDFIQAARQAIETLDVRPQSMIVCAAGPLNGSTIKLTNASWMLEGPALADRLGLEQGLLLNDFEALALTLPNLSAGNLRPVCGPVSDAAMVDRGAPRLAIGAGTGLGVAALIATGRRYLPLASEASHMDFAPRGEEETRIFTAIARDRGRVSAETLLSGPGLLRLHGARLACGGAPPRTLANARNLDAPALVTLALADREGQEAQSIAHFWRLLARFCGDMALAFVARGGIVLCGNIVQQILPFLEPQAFAAAFTDKSPMEGLAASIPVSLLQREDAVLHGMAALAEDPALYAIDYAQREWR